MNAQEEAEAVLKQARQAHIDAHNAWVKTLPVLPATGPDAFHEDMYLVDYGLEAWKYTRTCSVGETDDGEMCWIVGVESRGWDELGDMDSPFNYYVYNDSFGDETTFYQLPANNDIYWD